MFKDTCSVSVSTRRNQPNLHHARKCTALTMREVLTMKRFSKHLMHCVMHKKLLYFKNLKLEDCGLVAHSSSKFMKLSMWRKFLGRPAAHRPKSCRMTTFVGRLEFDSSFHTHLDCDRKWRNVGQLWDLGQFYNEAN